MTTPELRVDLASGTPPYEQLRAQLSGHILGGVLQPGARLPPIRQLAADLGLAGNTVARVYRELETEGLVSTRRRTGTVVTGQPHAVTDEVRATATRYAGLATDSGLTEAQALDVIRAALREARRGEPGRG